jgi:nitrogen fixation protein FixH
MKLEKGHLYPAMVVGILAIGVGASLILMIKATQDPSFSVEPDYYKKAVAFDELRAEEERSERMGWRVTFGTRPIEGQPTQVQVIVRLEDRDGALLDHAEVGLVAAPIARGRELVSAALAPLEPGIYGATLPMARPGLWEVQLEVRREDQRFKKTLRHEVLPSMARTEG